MAQIVCPYCLTPQTGRKISQCQNADCKVGIIPEEYVESVRRTPPIWLTMYGTTQHGKTATVDSMALWIETIGKIIEEASCDYLDDYTQEQVRLMRINDKEGLIRLESTQKGRRPLLIKVNNIIADREQTLIIYDLPGELADDVADAVEYAAAIRYAQTVWFIVSLDDLRADGEGRTLSTLFMNYQKTMKRLNAPVVGRSMLVIYTKADRLTRLLPPKVNSYIAEDPYSYLKSAPARDLRREYPFTMDSYMDNLAEISESLREYTIDVVSGGSDFVGRVKKADIRPLTYTITSALPMADASESAMGEIYRVRVLDPLLWTLHNGGEPVAKADSTLIIESGTQSADVFDTEVDQAVIDALRRLGIAVNIYFTGYSRPVTLKGSDEMKPVARRLNTIGPILDRLSDGERVILITKTEPYDLRDYEFSGWNKRLILIALDGTVADYWDRRIVWDDDLDLTDALTEYLQS